MLPQLASDVGGPVRLADVQLVPVVAQQRRIADPQHRGYVVMWNTISSPLRDLLSVRCCWQIASAPTALVDGLFFRRATFGGGSANLPQITSAAPVSGVDYRRFTPNPAACEGFTAVLA